MNKFLLFLILISFLIYGFLIYLKMNNEINTQTIIINLENN